MMFAIIKPFDRLIVTACALGRILALHAHRCKRVRKKWQRALVVQSGSMTPEQLPRLIEVIRTIPRTDKCTRRLAAALRKAGIPVHAERR